MISADSFCQRFTRYQKKNGGLFGIFSQELSLFSGNGVESIDLHLLHSMCDFYYVLLFFIKSTALFFINDIERFRCG